ncbi:MAG: SPASM domain-containing protein, partial [Thermodesulfobacteriota bacterium]|nr:SPASM domain-containing protein [Thermodesulfobacteriota bacterium]
NEGCMSMYEPWLSEADEFLREELLKRGYNTLKPMPMGCMIENKDTYVVNFDGVIYKCPAFIGKEGFAIGDIKRGVGDYTDSYKVGIWKNEECARCRYLPLCFGGCRYMSFVREGNIDTLDCKKAYFDSSLETLIKQDIKYIIKDKYGRG